MAVYTKGAATSLSDASGDVHPPPVAETGHVRPRKRLFSMSDYGLLRETAGGSAV